VKNNLHIFLGATVADAAARPLHWVYDQKKLNSYIKNKKDFAFLKYNKSPFYNIKTGKVSGYNEVGQVMFNTIIREIDLAKNNIFGQKNLNLTVKKIERRFKTNVIKHFGQGSLFWKNLKTRNKYKKIKWTKPINGPWIHQNVIDTIKNIKAKKKVTGSIKVNESDGFCAALPYFSIFNDFKNLKKVMSLICANPLSIKYGLAKFYIISFALKGYASPIKEFLKKFSSNKYFKQIISEIREVTRLKSLNHQKAAKKFGMACSYPGNFKTSIHVILNSKSYKDAILKTIRAGGCNCSRANFIGAYFSAINPNQILNSNWLKKCSYSRAISIYLSK